MHLIYLAWRNIISNPLQLLLNIILFALGIGLIHFLVIFNDQLKDKFDKNLAGIDMVLGAKGSALQLILCNMYHIDNPTGNISIKEAKPFLRKKNPMIKNAVPISAGDSYQSFRIIGTEHIFLDLYEGKLQEGKLWNKNLEAVIGSNVAKKTNMKLGDKFFSSHGFTMDDQLVHEEGQFVVVGILEQSGTVLDQLLLCNTPTIWQVHEHQSKEDTIAHQDDHQALSMLSERDMLLQNEDKEITSILVQFQNRKSFQALSMPRNIRENTELMAASPAYEINRLFDMIGLGAKALSMIAYLIAAVSFISIFISLLNALRSRKYELALIRVMGGKPFSLFALVLLEGVILAVIGFIVGVLISYIGYGLMAGKMSEAYQYNFEIFKLHPISFYLLLASIGVGLLAAVIPGIMAYRTNIHSTLLRQKG